MYMVVPTAVPARPLAMYTAVLQELSTYAARLAVCPSTCWLGSLAAEPPLPSRSAVGAVATLSAALLAPLTRLRFDPFAVAASDKVGGEGKDRDNAVRLAPNRGGGSADQNGDKLAGARACAMM